MAINPKGILRIKERWSLFRSDHPKVTPFMRALKENAMVEGTVLELKATTPAGEEYTANIRLTANDIETIRMMSR